MTTPGPLPAQCKRSAAPLSWWRRDSPTLYPAYAEGCAQVALLPRLGLFPRHYSPQMHRCLLGTPTTFTPHPPAMQTPMPTRSAISSGVVTCPFGGKATILLESIAIPILHSSCWRKGMTLTVQGFNHATSSKNYHGTIPNAW